MLKSDDLLSKIQFGVFVFGLMGLLLIAVIGEFFSDEEVFVKRY
jgi:hypothetical protein